MKKENKWKSTANAPLIDQTKLIWWILKKERNTANAPLIEQTKWKVAKWQIDKLNNRKCPNFQYQGVRKLKDDILNFCFHIHSTGHGHNKLCSSYIIVMSKIYTKNVKLLGKRYCR